MICMCAIVALDRLRLVSSVFKTVQRMRFEMAKNDAIARIRRNSRGFNFRPDPTSDGRIEASGGVSARE